MTMGAVYTKLFLYVPLALVGLIVSLMMIPHGFLIPWEYIHVWTAVKSLTASYALLSIIAAFLKQAELSRALILMALAVGVIASGFCYIGLDTLYYMFALDHVPSFVVLTVLVTGYGSSVIKRAA